VHYCVTNIPAAVPHTSTLALTNATFPYVLKLAKDGIHAALHNHKDIQEGVNTCQGKLTYKAVAESQHKTWTPIADLLYHSEHPDLPPS
jgi:alanine dehydrogenase